jgi:hypothetical protein
LPLQQRPAGIIIGITESGALKMTSADNRSFPRYYTVIEKSGLGLCHKDGNVPIPGRVYDVSRDGVGFIANERIVPGGRAVLQVGDKTIEFQIVYCTQDIINPDVYRVGLQRMVTTENLVTLFQVNNLLKENPT